MAGKWSAEERALLKELLTAHTVREARQKLGRSEYAVRKQMRKLKDSKDPVKYEDMNREDGENIRRMYKRAENKVERLKILKELYPSYTKETILAAAFHNPFREIDKKYEQITKEKDKMPPIKKYDEQTRKAVVEDVLLNGMTQSEAAEKYGVNPKSVSYWCTQAKKKQQRFVDYADQLEKERVTEKNMAGEGNFPYTHFKAVPEEDERQDVQSIKDIENVEFREPTLLELAERYTGEAIRSYEKAMEIINQLAYDDPERMELEEKLKKGSFRDKGTDESRKRNQDYNKLNIKAAAFDEICNIRAEYPDRRERELLFYINGIIGLAERLRCGNDNE